MIDDDGFAIVTLLIIIIGVPIIIFGAINQHYANQDIDGMIVKFKLEDVEVVILNGTTTSFEKDKTINNAITKTNFYDVIKISDVHKVYRIDFVIYCHNQIIDEWFKYYGKGII